MDSNPEREMLERLGTRYCEICNGMGGKQRLGAPKYLVCDPCTNTWIIEKKFTMTFCTWIERKRDGLE